MWLSESIGGLRNRRSFECLKKHFGGRLKSRRFEIAQHSFWGLGRLHDWLVVSNIFGIFTPKIGEDSHFDEHIFQRGWCNHQLDENVEILQRADPQWGAHFESASRKIWDEMIAFLSFILKSILWNVCVRAFMTVMNDRLIQVRSRLFFESSSLCSGIVEHLTLLTSVPGQIELVNTETPRQVGHACLKKKRGCLGVKFFHGIPVIFYSKEVCDFSCRGTLLEWPSNLSEFSTFSDRKHGAKTPWNSSRMHGRPDRRFTAAPIRQLGWRDLWHGDPRKPILFSGRLVLSETVSCKNTHREFRCLPVYPSVTRPETKKLTCTVKTGGLAL